MSLLDDNFEDFVFVERTRIPDGDIGFDFLYSDGDTFKACVRLDDSSQTDIARAESVRNIYTITVSKTVSIGQKNIIRRISDGKTFRITSDGCDNKTPAGAGLDMRQVRAEEAVIYTNPKNNSRQI